MDRLFVTKSKSDYLRVMEYIKNNGGYVLEAIGDDWHGAFMIKYRYYNYIYLF